MEIINNGTKQGKTLVDNAGVPSYNMATLTMQQHYARRTATDIRFRAAVRAASRSDVLLQGRETALERVVRSNDAIARSHETEEDIALKVTREKRRLSGNM